MGRAAVPLETVWPQGADPKTLVCIRAQCTAEELFNTLFVEPDLQEQLHKQRGDSNLVATPWRASREELPQQLYTWEAPPPPPAAAAGEGGRSLPSATLRYRKVRFESPPAAMASKPFQNEETQTLTQLRPGQLYVVEAVSFTSAPYGDKFSVFFRYIIQANAASNGSSSGSGSGGSSGSGSGGSSGSSCTLHLVFHVEFLASMNRMMRPVVGKAIDAGVRGTFRIFRTVLGSLRPCADIREVDLPPPPPAELPPITTTTTAAGEETAPAAAGAAAAEEAAKAALAPAATPAAGAAAAAAGAPPGLLGVLTQQLVYKEQVVVLADLLGAGLRSLTHSDGGAQLLAALLTVWLVSIVVSALRGWQAFCGVLLTHGSLLDEQQQQQLCSSEGGGGRGGGGGAGNGGGGVLGVVRLGVCWPLRLVDVPDSTAEVLTSLALVAAINWAVIRGVAMAVRYASKEYPGLLAAARGGAAAAGGAADAASSAAAPAPSAPVAPNPASREPSSKAAATSGAEVATAPSGAAAVGPGKGKEEGKDKGASAASGKQAATAAAAGTAAAPARAPPAPKPRPLRAAPAPKQFSAAQLRQLELGTMSSSSGSSSSKPGAATAGAAADPSAPAAAAAVPAAAAMSDAWAADSPSGMVTPPQSNGTATSPAPAAAAAAAAPTAVARSTSPAPAPGNSESANGMAAAAAAPAAKQPDGGGASGSAVGGGGGSPTLKSPAKPLTGPSGAQVPGFPPASAASGATAPATTAASFANMFTIDSMAESFRSAFRWDVRPPESGEPGFGLSPPDRSASPIARAAYASATSTTLPAAAGSTAPASSAKDAKARSDAGVASSSPAFASDATASAAAAAAAAAAASSRHGARSLGGGGGGVASAPYLGSSSVAMSSLYSARSDSPLLGGLGEEAAEVEPAVVVEEVFENERFQPFRGWGHMWPGHFLPSDRVGHWSDRQGKPGGSASMAFEQVVPLLPRGWRWLEEEWQVDLEGLEAEDVDADGWTYAMDFYLLKYPPPPQGGKCSLKHFVRRRRYYRTRVREGDGALPPSSAATSAGGGGGGTMLVPLGAAERVGHAAGGRDAATDAEATDPVYGAWTAAAAVTRSRTAPSLADGLPPVAGSGIMGSAAEGHGEQPSHGVSSSLPYGLQGAATAALPIAAPRSGGDEAPQPQPAATGSLDADAGFLRSGEAFVLSPKTVMTCHDPLGALRQLRRHSRRHGASSSSGGGGGGSGSDDEGAVAAAPLAAALPSGGGSGAVNGGIVRAPEELAVQAAAAPEPEPEQSQTVIAAAPVAEDVADAAEAAAEAARMASAAVGAVVAAAEAEDAMHAAAAAAAAEEEEEEEDEASPPPLAATTQPANSITLDPAGDSAVLTAADVLREEAAAAAAAAEAAGTADGAVAAGHSANPHGGEAPSTAAAVRQSVGSAQAPRRVFSGLVGEGEGSCPKRARLAAEAPVEEAEAVEGPVVAAVEAAEGPVVAADLVESE